RRDRGQVKNIGHRGWCKVGDVMGGILTTLDIRRERADASAPGVVRDELWSYLRKEMLDAAYYARGLYQSLQNYIMQCSSDRHDAAIAARGAVRTLGFHFWLGEGQGTSMALAQHWFQMLALHNREPMEKIAAGHGWQIATPEVPAAV